MKQTRDVFTLHRYFIAANRMRTHFDELIARKLAARQAGIEPPDTSVEEQLYMGFWYAGLYVVLEGWKRLRLSDPAVDALLKSPNVGLLKRYRHGIFHFQPDYFDERLTNLWGAGAQVVVWVRELNSTIGGFFLRWFDEHEGASKGARR